MLEYSTTDLACMLTEGLPQGGASATLTALRTRVGQSPAPDATRVLVAAACEHAVRQPVLWQGVCGSARGGALQRAQAVALLRTLVAEGEASAGEVHRYVFFFFRGKQV